MKKQELHGYVVVEGEFTRCLDVCQPTGGELAEVLAQGLPMEGVVVYDTEAIDFSHYIDCEVDGTRFQLTVGEETVAEPDTNWCVMPGAGKGVKVSRIPDEHRRQLLLAINRVLHQSDRVTAVCWYPQFETPEFLALMHRADSPIIAENYWETLHPLIRGDYGFDDPFRLLRHPWSVMGLTVFYSMLASSLWIPNSVAGGAILLTAGWAIFIPLRRYALITREAARILAERKG